MSNQSVENSEISEIFKDKDFLKKLGTLKYYGDMPQWFNKNIA